MFYEAVPADKQTGSQVSAQIALTPSESKRLIAKAVASLPEVKRAFENGLIRNIGRRILNLTT